LARPELQRNGWDIKRHLRLLVTSATYRQSSKTDDARQQRDPENLLLARGPRFRMPAEVIRDQTLFVSGLLSPKMFGPPVRPPQPSLGLSAAFGSTLDWKPSDGEDRYRRGVYTEWRRTSPYASMATFDAPSREICTIRRPRSNTPLQALVTLNDPVFFEAARALAQRTLLNLGQRPSGQSTCSAFVLFGHQHPPTIGSWGFTVPCGRASRMPRSRPGKSPEANRLHLWRRTTLPPGF